MSEQEKSFVIPTSKFAVGIDFGTTNSSVAIYRKGNFYNFPIDKNKTSMPSAVRFYEDDGKPQIAVGTAAKDRALIFPNEIFLSVKTLMMSDDWKEKEEFKEIKEKFNNVKGFPDLTPVKVAAEILKKIMNEVNSKQSESEGDGITDLGGDVQRVVICVPANATDTYKKNILEAAKLANIGLKDESGELKLNENGEPRGVSLLKEPEAAALTYGVENDFFAKRKKNTIMLYDFGGGTIDVTILEIDSTDNIPKFKPLGHSGDNKLGGDNIDRAIMELANDYFKDSSGIDIFDLNSDQGGGIARKTLLEAQQKLKIAVEEQKIITLANGSEDAIAKIEMTPLLVDGDGNPHNLSCEISKSDVLKKIEPLINRSLDVADNALKESGLTIDDINRIIMVGGSSKADWVTNAIKKHYEKDPYVAPNVDLYVSMGAAYEAFIKFTPTINSAEKYQKTVFLYRNIGIETQGGIFGLVLPKGTDTDDENKTQESNIIASATRTFYNPGYSDHTQIVIWETGEDIPYEEKNGEIVSKETYYVNKKDANGKKIFNCIGEFILTNIPKAPERTIPIKVTMELDKNEILRVKAVAEGGGDGEEITLNVSSK